MLQGYQRRDLGKGPGTPFGLQPNRPNSERIDLKAKPQPKKK
jgi:hypothetical protein